MHHNNPSYKELFEENKRLKKQLESLTSNTLKDEHIKLNAQLNKYVEELEQTFEVLKRQKEELEENKIRFQLLEDNISDVIWMMDLKGHLTFVSSSASKVFGYSMEEFSKLGVSDILTEESYLLHRAMLKKRITQEKKGVLTTGTSVELMHVRKGGELFSAEVSSNPIRDSENKIIGLAGVTRDISKRTSTEHEIRKLSVAVEQNPASIVITDVEGKIEYVNTTFCKVTGYTTQEAIGKNPRILKSEKNPKEIYEDLWSTIKRGEIWRGELINRKKSGENYWERLIISPITDSENKIVNFVAIKENVTAQKIAEQELKDNQERYKLLSDISLEGIIIHENGLILDANQSVKQITGYEIHELVGKEPVEKLFTQESIQIIRKHVEEKYERPYEVIALRKDGSTFPAEVEARQYEYKDRTVRVAALRDITYRKRVEDVLRTSLKMNELLLTHNEQEIIDWGLEEAVRLSDSHIGFFHYINDDQNTISLQTWSKETLKNCDVPEKTEHYPISEAGTWVDSFHQKKPVIHNNYQTLPHKKGLPEGHFPLLRYISLPVIEEDKVKIIFGVGNKRDDYTQFDADILSLLAKTIWLVIQRKRMEYELKESNTAKDKFLSIISHDLRSPIGSIQGLTEALLENLDSFSPDEMLNFIDTIHKTVSGTYNLVDNMLIWAQNHRNKIEFSPQNAVLKEIIDNAVHVELAEADKKEITIDRKIGEKVLIKADLNMLSTVLRNLIFNAIKFTNRGGKIEISCSLYDDKKAKVSIIDNGIGMPEGKLSKLFRIDESISTKGTENEKGTGLGLVLCKEFVERNGGKIWVESEVGKGSSFHFTIPFGER